MSTLAEVEAEVQQDHETHAKARAALATAAEAVDSRAAVRWLVEHYPAEVLFMGLWHRWPYPHDDGGTWNLKAHIPNGCPQTRPYWFSERLAERMHEPVEGYDVCLNCLLTIVRDG